MKLFIFIPITLISFLGNFSNSMASQMEEKKMEWTEFSFVLKPSSLGGIGVFAIHDIPVGTIKTSIHKKVTPRTMKVKEVPPELLKYCVYLSDEECHCPERFDRMEIGWYLNHSDYPNIAKNSNNETVVVRPIRAGDEVLLDYNQLNEPDHLKEAYYFNPEDTSWKCTESNLIKIAHSYGEFLRQAGKAENQDEIDQDIPKLFAHDCKKIVNGKTLFNKSNGFGSSLFDAQQLCGKWRINPDYFHVYPSTYTHSLTINYILATENIQFLVLAVLKVDLNGLINQVFEVYTETH